MLEAQREGGDDEPAAIVAMMSSLEAMMDASPGVAGYLMARLQPLAGRRRLHATYDGIELWMAESRSDALAESLTRLAGEGVRPLMRKRCEAWAARIRGGRPRSGDR